MSKEAILAAGTKFKADINRDGTLVQIPGITGVGATGDEVEGKDKTTLADTRKIYGAALPDSPDKPLKGQYLSTDPEQKAFIAIAQAREAIDCEMEWPDGTIGKFTLQLLGFKLDENSPEDWLMFTIPSRQNTDVDWTFPTIPPPAVP